MGTQVCFNEGPPPFPSGDNNEMHLWVMGIQFLQIKIIQYIYYSSQFNRSTLWCNRYDSFAQMCLLLELAMSRVSDVANGSLISLCLGPAREYFADIETSLMSVLKEQQIETLLGASEP